MEPDVIHLRVLKYVNSHTEVYVNKISGTKFFLSYGTEESPEFTFLLTAWCPTAAEQPSLD